MTKVQCVVCVFFCTLVPSAAANGVSSTPSSVWVTNGFVYDVAVQGTTVYVGGAFTRIAPKTGPFTMVDRVTAQPDLSLPRVTGGTISAIARDGAGGFIIAGAFTHVGGVPRRALARLTATGLLDPTFAPTDVTLVGGVTASAGRVFVSGNDGLVALDLATGERLPWAPGVNLTSVLALYAGPSSSVLAYALAGSGYYQLYRLDGTTGAVLWVAAITDTLVVDGNFGYAFDAGGVTRLDLATGTATTLATLGGPWCTLPGRFRPPCVRPDLALLNGRLYVTGSFGSIQGVARNGAAAIDVATGDVLPWIAPADRADRVSGVTADATRVLLTYGYDLRNLVAVDAVTGVPTGWEIAFTGTIRDVIGDSSHVVVVGTFNGAGGVERKGLAAVEWPSGRPLDWNPHIDGSVEAMARAGNRLYVAVYSATGHELIEIDIPTATKTGWRVSSNALVSVLQVAGTRLFVASRTPTPRGHLASFDVSGAMPMLEPWAPVLPAEPYGITSLIATFGVVLVGGSLGVGSAPDVAAIDGASAERLPWRPEFTWQYPLSWWNSVYLDVVEDRVFVSGSFMSINGQTRVGLAAFDLTGRLLPFTASPPPPGLINTSQRATVFEDRIYIAGGYSLRRASGTRTSWTPDLEGNLSSRWSPAPGLGVILVGSSFAFYPRAEPPGAVSSLAAAAAGNRLDLSWSVVAGANSYLIEVGSTAGASNLTTLETTSTIFSGAAPDGRYYVRVRASSDGGEGPPSNELRVGLGANACVAPPGATGALAFSRSGRSVTLEWPAGTGPAATRYLVEVGSTPGDRDLAIFDVGTLTSVGGTVPPGRYFVRVIAENLCGASAASNELSITVP